MTTRAARAAMEREAALPRPAGLRYIARREFRAVVDGKSVTVGANTPVPPRVWNALSALQQQRLVSTRYVIQQLVEL